jgi:hypothetical protein
MQQQRSDPARYYLGIIDSLKAMTGPAAIFESQHVYGAGQPSMDMDAVGRRQRPACLCRPPPSNCPCCRGRGETSRCMPRQAARAAAAAAAPRQVPEGGVVAHRDNRGAIYRFKVIGQRRAGAWSRQPCPLPPCPLPPPPIPSPAPPTHTHKHTHTQVAPADAAPPLLLGAAGHWRLCQHVPHQSWLQAQRRPARLHAVRCGAQGAHTAQAHRGSASLPKSSAWLQMPLPRGARPDQRDSGAGNNSAPGPASGSALVGRNLGGALTVLPLLPPPPRRTQRPGRRRCASTRRTTS